MRSTTPNSPPPRRALATTLLAAALLASACGTQRATDDLTAGAPSVPGVLDAPTDPATGAVLEPGEVALDAPATPGAATPALAGSPPPNGPATGPGPAPQPGAAPQPGSPTAQAPGPAPAPGAPIRIGAVGTLSGLGAVQRGTIVAVQAWAASVNERGGLAGHPVEVIVADDRGDAAQLRAAVQNLVEEHHVVAFVGNVTAFSLSQATIDYLEKVRVPFVGGDRTNPLWYQSPMLFPQAAAADAAIWIQMLHVSAVAPRGSAVGWLVCREAQQCRDSDTQFAGYAEQLGLKPKFNRQVSITQPDFTIECRQAAQAGVQYLILGLDVNSVRRVAHDCAQQQYRPVFLSPQTADSMAGQPEFDRLLFASATFPWVRADDDATRRYHDALATHAPDLELSAHSSSGWVSALLFERAVSRTIPAGAEPSATKVLEGLWSIRDDTLGGLTAPLTFVRDEPAPKRFCYFPMSIRDKRWNADSPAIICQAPAS